MSSQKEHFHIVLPEGYKQVLKITAAKAAISISGLVQQAIDDFLTERSSKDGSKAYDKGN